MRELPEGWEWVTVGDVAEVQGGIQKQPKRAPVKNKYPFLRVANLAESGLSLDDVHEIELFEGELERFALRPGDLLVVEGNGSVSRVGQGVAWQGQIPDCVHQNHLIRVRPTRHIEARYLELAWNSPAVSESLQRVASSTSGLHTLSTRKINAVQIPLPPLAEQRRIVAALEEQLSRLETGELLLKTSQSRCGALESHVRDVALDALSEEPTQVLGSLLKEPLRNGYSARAVSEGGVRTLTLTAVTKNEFSDANTKMTSAENEKVANLWLNPGDILIQRSNTPDLVGTSALYSGPSGWAIFPDLLIRARVNNEVMPSFVQLVLSSGRVRKFFKGKAKGLAGSMPKIDQRTIESVEIPVPSLDRQREVVERVGSQISALTRVSNSIDKLEKRSTHLRRSLLSAAFSGKLVPQDPDDEPASVLLERIRAERAATAKPKRGRRAATRQQPASTPAPPDPAPVVSGEQTALEF